jgi:hypothetical protein
VLAVAICFCHRGLLLSNNRAARRHFGVQSGVVGPLFWQVVFVEDGLYRTLRNACFTIDAFFRVDVKDRWAFVKALDRANDDTICVFAVEARFSDDVCHQVSLSVNLSGRTAQIESRIGTVGIRCPKAYGKLKKTTLNTSGSSPIYK